MINALEPVRPKYRTANADSGESYKLRDTYVTLTDTLSGALKHNAADYTLIVNFQVIASQRIMTLKSFVVGKRLPRFIISLHLSLYSRVPVSN